MPIRKSALACAVATAVSASGGIIGASTAPAASVDATTTAADPITNTESTAKRLCVSHATHDHYDTVEIENYQSLDGEPSIGKLYVVRLSDSDHNDRTCAIVIKGNATDGAHHTMYVEIEAARDLPSEWDEAEGMRSQVIGPVYVGPHWDNAWGDMVYRDELWDAYLEP